MDGPGRHESIELDGMKKRPIRQPHSGPTSEINQFELSSPPSIHQRVEVAGWTSNVRHKWPSHASQKTIGKSLLQRLVR